MSEVHVKPRAASVQVSLPLALRSMTLLDALFVTSRVSDEERVQVEALSGEPFAVDHQVLAAMAHDISYTATAPDGVQVMIGGFDFPHAHLARCWSLSTAHWPCCVRNITRATRTLIAMVFAETEVHRMEILSHGARRTAHYWYTRSLGFTEESVLHCYGHAGEDFILFARTADGSDG